MISCFKSGCKPVELKRHQVIPATLLLNLMIVLGTLAPKHTCARWGGQMGPNKLAPDGEGPETNLRQMGTAVFVKLAPDGVKHYREGFKLYTANCSSTHLMSCSSLN